MQVLALLPSTLFSPFTRSPQLLTRQCIKCEPDFPSMFQLYLSALVSHPVEMPPASNIPTLVEPFAGGPSIQSWYTAYLAPVERIPVEVLCEIFAWHCLPLTPAELCIEPNNRPVILSSVCRRWRDTAISCGKLWANIDAVVDTDGSVPSLPLIRMQLRRSKTAPLTISVRQALPTQSSFLILIPILYILRPQLARAKSFRLCFQALPPGSYSDPSTGYLPIFADRISRPLLQSVALVTNNLSRRDMTLLSDLLFPAPRLSKVYWGSQHCLDQLNWDHLHSLDLDPGTVDLTASVVGYPESRQGVAPP